MDLRRRMHWPSACRGSSSWMAAIPCATLACAAWSIGCSEPTASAAAKRTHPSASSAESDAAVVAAVERLLTANDRAHASLARVCQPLNGEQKRAVHARLLAKLAAMTGKSPDEDVGRLLEAVQALGPVEGASYEPLVTALSPRAPIYVGRAKPEANRLRAFVLASVASVGHAADAVGIVVDHLNNGMSPGAVAAGARAAGELPQFAEAMTPLLRRYVKGSVHDSIISLDRYVQSFPAAERTSVQLECIRALARYGPRAAAARPDLLEVVEVSSRSVIPNPLPILQEAAHALAAIDGKR